MLSPRQESRGVQGGLSLSQWHKLTSEPCFSPQGHLVYPLSSAPTQTDKQVFLGSLNLMMELQPFSPPKILVGGNIFGFIDIKPVWCVSTFWNVSLWPPQVFVWCSSPMLHVLPSRMCDQRGAGRKGSNSCAGNSSRIQCVPMGMSWFECEMRNTGCEHFYNSIP